MAERRSCVDKTLTFEVDHGTGEQPVKTSDIGRVALAFLIAVIVATAWGTIVQTQYNLAALATIGLDVEPLRLQTTMRDLFSGFFPTYGGYIVLPSLLVAFVVAALVLWKWLPADPLAARLALFALAGGLAVLIGIPLVNWLSPLALLVGASRDFSCTAWMSVGGIWAGLIFAVMTHRRLWTVRHAGESGEPEAHPSAPR